MKKFILKIVIIQILIYSIFCINTNCLASFDFARIESAGNSEPVVVPEEPAGDSGDGYVPTPPTVVETTPVEPSVSISVPTRVKGTVFEDYEKLEKVMDGSMAGTEHITNNYRIDVDEPGINGAIVSFSGTEVITDSDGSYSFNTPGSYDVTFTYGKRLDENDYSLNYNTLKYNGQDYNVVLSGAGCSSYDKSFLRKIQEVEKSYTEVYIVIDYSTSMRLLGDGERARIEIVKESAINFVNALFEKAEGNLAVGYIAFAYESAIIKKPTDVKSAVIDAITNFNVEDGVGKYSGAVAPNFSSLNHRVGSNISGAVFTAKNNYLATNTNKIMVLFSDGAATAHDDVTSLYVTDTDEQMENKLNQVAEKTKADLKTIVNSGITLINILNQTEGTEKTFVEKSFKDGSDWIGNYYEVNYYNKEAVESVLLNNTMKIIENSESEFVNYIEEKTFNGDDDIARRRTVNNNYDILYYDKLRVFEAIDQFNGTENNDIDVIAKLDKYDNSYFKMKKKRLYKKFITNENDAVKFVENSWMKSISNNIELYKINKDGDGKVTSISNGNTTVYKFEYYKNDEDIDMCKVIDSKGTGLGGEYKASNVHVSETTLKLDAALIKRDEFKLELEKIITGVRLTLSDGTILYDLRSSNAGKTVEKNNEFKEIFCKQLQEKAGLIDGIDTHVKNLEIEEVLNTPDAVYLIADAEILQGATIEVEYTLIIKNNSHNGTFSDEIAIVDYFDNGLEYRKENSLLTEEGTNSDYGWTIINKNEVLGSTYFSQNTKDNANNKCLYISYNSDEYKKKEDISNDGQIADYTAKTKYVNPVIGNNGERYVKVVLSRVLSPEILDDFIYVNQAEIIKYSNNNERRINWIRLSGTTTKYEYPISGNYVPSTVLEGLADEFTKADEIDTAISKRVSIIPPTGRRLNEDIFTKMYFKILGMIRK